MRTQALLYFRLSPKELAARLPNELRFLGTDFIQWLDGTRLNRELDPETLSLLIHLGRARIGGATVLSGVRLDHRYGRDELNGDHAELLQDIQDEPAVVLNAVSAYEGRWSCTHCDRVAVSQIGPLELENINLGVDLQVAANDEVVLVVPMPARQRRLADRSAAGRPARLRPGDGTSDRHTHPCLSASGYWLGLPRLWPATYDRSDKVEGGGPIVRATGLVINQEWPLTVEVGLDAVGQSRERVNWRGNVSQEPRHVVGERVDLVENTSWQVGKFINVLRLTLIDALLRAGASMPDLGPLIAGNAAPCPRHWPVLGLGLLNSSAQRLVLPIGLNQ